jgi:aminoglycoside phosphotransferase (APT) family kinase protein
VALHGDFGVFNILFLPPSDRMVVIDWANADWVGVEADLGAPEIDIAVFLISLFHRRLLGPWPVARRHDVARHFLSTYQSASQYGVDIGYLRALVAAITPSFVRQTRRDRGNLRALGYRHGMVDLDLFLRRSSREGFAGPGSRHPS